MDLYGALDKLNHGTPAIRQREIRALIDAFLQVSRVENGVSSRMVAGTVNGEQRYFRVFQRAAVNGRAATSSSKIYVSLIPKDRESKEINRGQLEKMEALSYKGPISIGGIQAAVRETNRGRTALQPVDV